MKTITIDYLNIGLIILSFILAFNLPFELFLFSYAVLGPLHYMTEIGWLHKKNYFTVDKRDFWVLIFWGTIFFSGYMASQMQVWEWSKDFIAGVKGNSAGNFVVDQLIKWTTSCVFLAFCSALAITFFKNNYLKYGFILVCIPIAYFFMHIESRNYLLFFGVFMPTIIHVCIFTALFMLFGALKSKSKPGMISMGLFLLLAASFFVMDRPAQGPEVSQYVKESFVESRFQIINVSIFNLFDSGSFRLDSGLGLNIQRFIAFVYTYHYLNWFSKTSIIQWHNVSKTWMGLTIGVWIASVALYVYDYKVGFAALVALSSLHVFLEFPLNYQSFKGIYTSLAGSKS